MIIRQMHADDADELLEIHSKFYKDEFVFDEFSRDFIELFVVTENGKIISGGGVRPIAESVLVTDKSLPVPLRKEALELILNVSKNLCLIHGYDQLHAFVQEPAWEKVLRKYNFKDCKGKALYLQVT